jgi:hypothetical protein
MKIELAATPVAGVPPSRIVIFAVLTVKQQATK